MVIFVAAAAAAQPAAEADESSPRNLFLSGRYAEAIAALPGEAQRAPSDEVLLAHCHSATGNAKAARATLTDAIRRNGNSALLKGELAQLELASGDYQAAIGAAQAALALDQNCLAARWVQAEHARLHGKLDEAQAGYEWLVRFQNSGGQIPRSEDRRLVGLAAAQLARWTRNHEQFKRLVSDIYPQILVHEPRYWPANLELARLFAEKYNESDAMAALGAGLATNPHAADLHVLRAQLALEKFDLGTARSAVERALAIDSNHLGARRAQADILLADIRPVEAIAILEQARRLQPHDEETLGRLAAAYAATDGFPGGKPAPRMVSLMEHVEAANPHCGSFYLAAGDTLDRMRLFPQAAHQYRQAQSKMPQLVATRGKLGMTLMRLGEEVEAALLLEEAFTVDPYNVRVKNTLEVLDVLKGYSVLESEHFVLKFDRGRDELLAKYAVRYLEREVYPQLVAEFGFRPQGKTLIEIFSRHRHTSGHGWFSARMTGLPAIGTVGACAGRMIALTSPDEVEPKFDWARVLRHEYVHVLNLQQTEFCIPHWFTEGLAVRSEGNARPRAWDEILARRAGENKLFDLDSLTFGFVRPANSDDWSLAYCQAALHVDFLHEKFGPASVAAMLAAYSQRKSTAEAIEQALALNQRDYELKYRQFVLDYLAKRRLTPTGDTPSLSALQKAAEAEHAKAPERAVLAKAYLERKNLPEARRWAVSALEMDERQSTAAYVLARVQLSIGDHRAALGLLENGLNEREPQEDLLSLLAALKLQTGDLTEAERLHKLGLKHFPSPDRWLKGLARIYLQRQDAAGLEPVLQSLAEREPGSVSIRKKLADLALDRRDFAAARRWALELTRLDLHDAEAHGQLAAAAHGNRELDFAAEEYETAVSLRPQELAWRAAWATVLVQLGKKENARQVVEDLRQLDAKYPGIEDLLEKLKSE